MTGVATRAWAWVDHLRAGGTTPWRDWLAGDPAAVAEPAVAERTDVLPGAQHLELVRRLNLLAPAGPALADRVLGTSPPGRGNPDLPIAGVAPPSRFGAAPVDPSQVPLDELVRLASGVVADLAVAAAPRPIPPFPEGRGRPFRVRYEILGNPLVSVRVRRELRAVGHPPGGWHPLVLVVVGDLESYLADAWAARVRRGVTPPWSAWLDHLAQSDTLPERLDAVEHARRAAARVGRRRVHVVTDESCIADLLKVPAAPVPPRISHAALDAARHTKGVLRVLLPEDQRELLVRRYLFPWFEAADAERQPPTSQPVVPARHRAWLLRQAERFRDELTRAGYAVHGGGLEQVVPRDPAGSPGRHPESPPETEILDVMLRVIHRAAQEAGA